MAIDKIPNIILKFLFDAFTIIKVWRVDGDELILVPAQEQIKLFSGDCYVVQYTYAGDGRDENLFYAWLGRASALVCMAMQ